MVEDIRKPKPKIKIALVGKYVELHDAYLSVREALFHAATRLGVDIGIEWIHAVNLEKENGFELLRTFTGSSFPGGLAAAGLRVRSKPRNTPVKTRFPTWVSVSGMQVMTIDFARSVLKTENVNSAEFDPTTPNPVIDLMPDQQHVTEKGGTMRLGLYPCRLRADSIAGEAYQTQLVQERHRHRFEFNNHYRDQLEENGMVFSGLSPDEQVGRDR